MIVDCARVWFLGLAFVAGCLFPLGVEGADESFPTFEEVLIDPHAGEIVYAVTYADVDKDAKLDIVAVTENAVYWYRNPSWEKHVIIKDQTIRDNVCIAAHDIDGDRQVDFAIGAGWPQAGGTIQWLQRGQSLQGPWKVHFIGEIPWTHRMRFADVLGTGKEQLTVSPLNKTEGEGVALTAFEIPADPMKDRWPATVLDHSLNRMHNHWHVGGKDRPARTITANEEGVQLIVTEQGGGFKKQPLNVAGAGEVKLGKLRSGTRMLATIEPMHGNKVVVATAKNLESREWTRHELDDTLGRGHALWFADVDKDGDDEVIVGHSEPATGEIRGPGVYIYDAEDAEGTVWKKHVIDNGGVAVEDAFAVDLTGDNWPDIVAGGRNTHNVKLYVNSGLKREESK